MVNLDSGFSHLELEHFLVSAPRIPRGRSATAWEIEDLIGGHAPESSYFLSARNMSGSRVTPDTPPAGCLYSRRSPLLWSLVLLRVSDSCAGEFTRACVLSVISWSAGYWPNLPTRRGKAGHSAVDYRSAGCFLQHSPKNSQLDKEILAGQESDRQPENDQPKDVKRFI
jgi:hypothetical protein